jgi:hypothetical protein
VEITSFIAPAETEPDKPASNADAYNIDTTTLVAMIFPFIIEDKEEAGRPVYMGAPVRPRSFRAPGIGRPNI